MLADAVGTLAGAVLGTSTVSSYIESASGVAEGARTGLANMLTAALFLSALFFAPVVAMVGGGVSVDGLYYYPITAPVVILVGSLMMAQAQRIAWRDPTEGIPAFATLTLIPFTFSGRFSGLCRPYFRLRLINSRNEPMNPRVLREAHPGVWSEG